MWRLPCQDSQGGGRQAQGLVLPGRIVEGLLEVAAPKLACRRDLRPSPRLGLLCKALTSASGCTFGVGRGWGSAGSKLHGGSWGRTPAVHGGRRRGTWRGRGCRPGDQSQRGEGARPPGHAARSEGLTPLRAGLPPLRVCVFHPRGCQLQFLVVSRPPLAPAWLLPPASAHSVPRGWCQAGWGGSARAVRLTPGFHAPRIPLP